MTVFNKTVLRKEWMYHCTLDDHGPTLKVIQKCPAKGSSEPNTPRLCVSPSVPQCFAARLFHGREVFVYRTRVKVRAIQAKGVWDEIVTDERWIRGNQTLEKIAVVPKEIVDAISSRVLEYHKTTGNESSLYIRLFQLKKAVSFLPEFEDPRLTKFVESVASRFDLSENNVFRKQFEKK